MPPSCTLEMVPILSMYSVLQLKQVSPCEGYERQTLYQSDAKEECKNCGAGGLAQL